MDFLNMIKSQLKSDWWPCADIWSPVQTDATLLANSPLHCWMLYVGSVCIPCYMLLRVVGNCCSMFETGKTLSDVQLTQQLPTWLGAVGQLCWVRLPAAWYWLPFVQNCKKTNVPIIQKTFNSLLDNWKKTHHLWIIVLSLDHRVCFFKEYLREAVRSAIFTQKRSQEGEKRGFIYAWAEYYLQPNTVGQHCTWADHYP